MNPLSDIIAQKSDDLFGDDTVSTNNDQSTTNNKAPAEKGNDEMTEMNFVTPDNSKEQIDVQKMKAVIHTMKDQLDSMLRMLNGSPTPNVTISNNAPAESTTLETGERIVEGVFNGEKMVGPDGKEYSIPPNYASKSKLVEGDLMKLTITNNGSFIYKQIQPVERKRITGELTSSENGYWSVLAEGKTYKVLTASVTFYKGKAGDEVVILVPEDGESSWGAVENIISKNT